MKKFVLRDEWDLAAKQYAESQRHDLICRLIFITIVAIGALLYWLTKTGGL